MKKRSVTRSRESASIMHIFLYKIWTKTSLFRQNTHYIKCLKYKPTLFSWIVSLVCRYYKSVHSSTNGSLYELWTLGEELNRLLFTTNLTDSDKCLTRKYICFIGSVAIECAPLQKADSVQTKVKLCSHFISLSRWSIQIIFFTKRNYT